MKINEQSHGNVDKVARYGWKVQDHPGELCRISKANLRVDHSYQRDANEPKVLAIAKDWSWVACGVIVVARRDGVYFVIDGQHRVMGALKRSDIDTLPCIVFNTHGSDQEAKGFLAAQTLRRPINSVEKFRAQVVVKDKAALIVEKMLSSSGHMAGRGTTAMSVSCISLLTKLAKEDEDLLLRLWPLIVELSAGNHVNSRLVDGLFYIENRMQNNESLLQKKWRDRVLKVGRDRLLDSAAKASAYFAQGGARVWAGGIVEAINHGHRNLLVIGDNK